MYSQEGLLDFKNVCGLLLGQAQRFLPVIVFSLEYLSTGDKPAAQPGARLTPASLPPPGTFWLSYGPWRRVTPLAGVPAPCEAAPVWLRQSWRPRPQKSKPRGLLLPGLLVIDVSC